MLKIERSDADIERIAQCLSWHSERKDVTDSYLMMIREIPDRWIKTIWPDATDADIVEEFKDAFYTVEMYELSPIDPEEDPYYDHAKWLRESWLTKKVDQMLQEGRIEENEIKEIQYMLKVIAKGKRRSARYVLQIVDDED